MTTALGQVAGRVLLDDPQVEHDPGPPIDRGRAGDAFRVRAAARGAAGRWHAGGRSLLQIWQQLAALGRRDLVLARLVEGHVDAHAILSEAGRQPVADAVYGVWASGSQGTGLQVEPTPHGHRLTGLVRFCTGADWVDRVLVTARAPGGDQGDNRRPGPGPVLLFDLPVTPKQWRPRTESWLAVGMDLSDSVDVEVDLETTVEDQVGADGFYLERPGFAVGGIGVAAVWLGGAAGVLDAVRSGLRRFDPDPHQLAHLGAMTVAVEQADALLARTAVDAADLGGADPGATDPSGLTAAALACRAAVDSCVQEVLVRAPRLTGPTPLCRDGDFAHRLADLAVYVRQQHAERDLAVLGRHALARRSA